MVGLPTADDSRSGPPVKPMITAIFGRLIVIVVDSDFEVELFRRRRKQNFPEQYKFVSGNLSDLNAARNRVKIFAVRKSTFLDTGIRRRGPPLNRPQPRGVPTAPRRALSRNRGPRCVTEHEKQRGWLIEALCRRGTALCSLLMLAEPGASYERLMTSLHDNTTDLLKFTDLTDAKAIQFGVWQCFAMGHWGRAVRLLNKMLEERPSKEIEERLIEVYEELGWKYLAVFTTKSLPVKYPTAY
ncbi:Tripeptidyl-peptidase 2, partial [Eumeta japonica]